MVERSTPSYFAAAGVSAVPPLLCMQGSHVKSVPITEARGEYYTKIKARLRRFFVLV